MNTEKPISMIPPCSKKRRFLDDSILDLSKPPAKSKFLGFHFQILKSMYNNEDSSDTSPSTTTTNTVEADTWTLIESFLKQREQLTAAKKEAASLQGIHKESLKHFTESGAVVANDNMSTMTNATTTPRQKLQFLSKPSPSMTFSSRPYSIMMSQASVMTTNNGDGGDRNHTNNSLEIVARLLGRRHQIVHCEFQQLTDRFQPLLVATNARISQLQSEQRAAELAASHRNEKHIQDLLAVNIYKEKKKHQRTSSSTENLSDSEQQRSENSKRECMIRLWSLLALDLKEAIIVHSPDDDEDADDSE